MLRICTVIAALSATVPAGAALKPETDKPYQLEVVLHLAPHRALTGTLKENMRSDLDDYLKQVLGTAAEIQVVDRHPLLPLIREKGLERAVNSYQPAGRSATAKVHFVLVSYVDNQYEIQTCQYDGLTGLANRVARRKRTLDRRLVGKMAAGLVLQDFGTVGTVTSAEDLSAVQCAIKSGKHYHPAIKVKRNDVFALSLIDRQGAGKRIPQAFLQVVGDPRGETCECRLLARFLDDASQLRSAEADGFRGMRLHTTTGPLRFRFLNAEKRPWEQLHVEISRHGFNGPFQFEGLTDRNGYLITRTHYKGIAFVRVKSNGKALAQIPVPVLDDRLQTFQIHAKGERDVYGVLRRDKESTNQTAFLRLQIYNEHVQAINKHLLEDKYQDALKEAEEAKASLDRDIPELRKEHRDLVFKVKRSPISDVDRRRLMDDASIQQLERASKLLETSIADFRLAIRRQVDQEEKQKVVIKLVTQARQLERQARYQEAIQKFEDALAKAGGKQPQIEKELTKLKASWKLKSQEHGKARAFIYGLWGKTNTPESIAENLEEARQACDVCIKNGDRLTLRKFIMVYSKQAETLGRALRSQERRTAAGVERFEAIDKVADELTILFNKVSEFVDGR